MPNLTPATKSVRVAQALEVLKLMHVGHSQAEACELVGMSPDMFRHWIGSGDEAIIALGSLIQAVEREELALINTTKVAILDKLLARLTDDSPVETSDLIKAIQYLDKRSDDLSPRHGAASDVESNARKYLKGPKLKQAKSKFGQTSTTVNVRPREDGSVDITTFREEDIIDAEEAETD